MQKIFGFLLSCFLISAVLSASGIKVGIDMETFKIVKKIDFNKFLQNKTLVEEASFNGTMIFDYEVNITNLTVLEIDGPKDMIVNSSKNEEGYNAVFLDAKDIKAEISLGFSAKFGLFKESSESVNITASCSSFNGHFYFDENGQVHISDFEVEISDLEIKMESKFLTWLIGLFKGLIKNIAEDKINDTRDKIAEAINKWVDNEFLYDLGFGIGFNLTSTDHPQLVPITKEMRAKSNFELVLKLIQYYAMSEEKRNRFRIDNSYNSSVLECGIHGSVYPNLQPEVQPAIDPAVEMSYEETYFDNQLQVLLSDYSLNTLLFMGQQTGFLKYEFNNQTESFLPLKFTTQGLSEQIPEFKNKYPTEDYPVSMQVYSKMGKYNQPIIKTESTGSKLILNFGLEFDTSKYIIFNFS
ncbi:MAG: hypothetical protein MJ252_10405 [archaeon]|nr:hypothetical protein [archaeon]